MDNPHASPISDDLAAAVRALTVEVLSQRKKLDRLLELVGGTQEPDPGSVAPVQDALAAAVEKQMCQLCSSAPSRAGGHVMAGDWATKVAPAELTPIHRRSSTAVASSTATAAEGPDPATPEVSSDATAFRPRRSTPIVISLPAALPPAAAVEAKAAAPSPAAAAAAVAALPQGERNTSRRCARATSRPSTLPSPSPRAPPRPSARPLPSAP